MQILLASSNQGKFTELSDISAQFPVSLISFSNFIQNNPSLGQAPAICEDKSSFSENALVKAEAIHAWGADILLSQNIAVLADDSGLEVFALNNFPGVHSARWAGEGVSDEERCKLLLKKMIEENVGEEKNERRCRFCCALALVLPNGEVINEEYFQEGFITKDLMGKGGFGYDPIVYIEELGSTYAELPKEKTKEHGFRAKAAKKLFKKISEN